MKAAWKMSPAPGGIDGIDAEEGGRSGSACHPGQDTGFSEGLRRSGESRKQFWSAGRDFFQVGSCMARGCRGW